MHPLSGSVPDFTQGDKWLLRNQPGFFRKLPDRRNEQIFAFFDIASRYSPHPVILTFPIRTSWMDQQDFKRSLVFQDAIHEQAGADLHGRKEEEYRIQNTGVRSQNTDPACRRIGVSAYRRTANGERRTANG